jgi:hypothetical protein
MSLSNELDSSLRSEQTAQSSKINASFSLRDCHAALAMTPKERNCHALWTRNDNGKAFIAFIIISFSNQSQSIRIYKPISEENQTRIRSIFLVHSQIL